MFNFKSKQQESLAPSAEVMQVLEALQFAHVEPWQGLEQNIEQASSRLASLIVKSDEYVRVISEDRYIYQQITGEQKKAIVYAVGSLVEQGSTRIETLLQLYGRVNQAHTDPILFSFVGNILATQSDINPGTYALILHKFSEYCCSHKDDPAISGWLQCLVRNTSLNQLANIESEIYHKKGANRHLFELLEQLPLEFAQSIKQSSLDRRKPYSPEPLPKELSELLFAARHFRGDDSIDYVGSRPMLRLIESLRSNQNRSLLTENIKFYGEKFNQGNGFIAVLYALARFISKDSSIVNLLIEQALKYPENDEVSKIVVKAAAVFPRVFKRLSSEDLDKVVQVYAQCFVNYIGEIKLTDPLTEILAKRCSIKNFQFIERTLLDKAGDKQQAGYRHMIKLLATTTKPEGQRVLQRLANYRPSKLEMPKQKYIFPSIQDTAFFAAGVGTASVLGNLAFELLPFPPPAGFLMSFSVAAVAYYLSNINKPLPLVNKTRNDYAYAALADEARQSLRSNIVET